MAKEIYRIEIPIETKDNYSKGLDKAKRDIESLEKSAKRSGKGMSELGNSAQNAAKGVEKIGGSASRSEGQVSRFQSVVQRTRDRLRDLSGRKWELTLRAVDRASHIIRSASSMASSFAGKTYSITLRAVDMVTRPLRGIMSAASSTLGLVGAAGGIGAGVVLPLKIKMDRQSVTTAFEVLLGSKQKADQRITELTEFAGTTPYTRDEIYKSSRILEVFTKGALSTGKGLRMVGDIAAGTQNDFENTALWMGRMYDGMASGRKIGEAAARLQELGAIDGAARQRLEDLAEAPMSIAKKWKLAEKEFQRFDGMMEKMSGNLQNLLLGAKVFFLNNMVARWGDGLSKALTPALKKFREWRSENSEGIKEMGNAFEKYGEKVAGFAIKKTSGAIGFLRKVFFPSKDEISKINNLLKHLTPEDAGLLNDPTFLTKDMSFSAKVKFVIDRSNDVFSEWWEKTGRDQVTGFSEKMGTEFGKIINGAILGMLGVDSKEGGNSFVSAGFEAGSSFVKGFLDGLDAGDLAWQITKKIGEINLKGATDPFKGNGLGSTAGALLVDTLLLGALSKVLSPWKLFKTPTKWAGSMGKGIWGKFFGKDKGPKHTTQTTKPTTDYTEHTKPTNGSIILDKNSRPLSNSQPSQPKGPVILDQHGRSLTSSTPKTAPSTPSIPKAGAGGKGLFPWLGKVLGPMGTFMTYKSIDTNLGDWFFGHKPGDVKDKGLLSNPFRNPMKQEFHDDYRQGWIYKMLGRDNPGVKKTASEPMTASAASVQPTGPAEATTGPMDANMQGVIHNIETLKMHLGNASSWVVGAFQPLEGAGAGLSHNITTLSDYLGQASSWVVDGLMPLQEGAASIGHNMSTLSEYLAQASGWVVEGLYPLQEVSANIGHNMGTLSDYLAQASGWIVEGLYPLSEGSASVSHNMNTLSEYLAQASGWVVEGLYPMQEYGAAVNHNLSTLTTYLGEASGWVVGAFQPIPENAGPIHHNMSTLASYLGQASGWVASINGIQGGAAAVKSALNNLASRINNVPTPRISVPSLPSFNPLRLFRRYATGTDFHPGGPAIVGDGGGSELIRYPDGKLALSPATDTLVNLPRGTKVMPHHKTAKMMDVPAYADGIGFDDVNPDQSGPVVGGNNTSIEIGDTHVTVVVQGGEQNDPDDLATRIADKVAGIIADKVERIAPNMPAT